MSLRAPSKRNQTLRLVGDHRLRIERTSDANVLKIMGPEGTLRLSIRVTADGPELQVEASEVNIHVADALNIDAGQVRIHGRDSLALTSGGDAKLAAAGDLDSSARIQNITATLGNVNVEANDDVRMNGERVLMNCD
jgi:hypothetical protein